MPEGRKVGTPDMLLVACVGLLLTFVVWKASPPADPAGGHRTATPAAVIRIKDLRAR